MTTTYTETSSKIRTIIAKRLGIAEQSVEPHARLVEELGADSFDMLEIIDEIEVTFRIRISPEDTNELGTLTDIIQYVDRCGSFGGSGG